MEGQLVCSILVALITPQVAEIFCHNMCYLGYPPDVAPPYNKDLPFRNRFEQVGN